MKRLQKNLKQLSFKPSPLIFADVHCKHAVPVSYRNLDLEVLDAFERGYADAVIISGDRTGSPVNIENLVLLKTKDLHPILIGSGVNTSNIKTLLHHSDGAIISSSLKINNLMEEKIDIVKAKKLISLANEIR